MRRADGIFLESLADCSGYPTLRKIQSAEPSKDRDFVRCMVLDILEEDRRHWTLALVVCLRIQVFVKD